MATMKDNEGWGSLPYGRSAYDFPPMTNADQTAILGQAKRGIAATPPAVAPSTQKPMSGLAIALGLDQQKTGPQYAAEYINKYGLIPSAAKTVQALSTPVAEAGKSMAAPAGRFLMGPQTAVKPTASVPSATVSPLVTEAAYGGKQPMYEGYVQNLEKMRQGQPGAQVPQYLSKANERPMPTKVEQPVVAPEQKPAAAPTPQERPAWMKESDAKLAALAKQQAQLAKTANDLSVSPAVRREARTQLQEANAMDMQERQNRFKFEVESEISRREIQKGQQLTDKEIAQIQGDTAKALGVAMQAKEGAVGAAREKAAGEVQKGKMGLEKAEIDALGKAFASGQTDVITQAVEAIRKSRGAAQAGEVGTVEGTTGKKVPDFIMINGVRHRYIGGDTKSPSSWQPVQ